MKLSTLFTLVCVLVASTSCREEDVSRELIISSGLIGGSEVSKYNKNYNAVVGLSGGTVCTATKVGDGLYILAGHCVTDYKSGKVSSLLAPGKELIITPHAKAFKKTKIDKVHIYPGYTSEMRRRLLHKDDSPEHTGFAASDVALIKIRDNFRDIRAAKISFERVDEGRTVSIMGTGCEVSTRIRRAYKKRLKTRNVKVINKLYSVHNFADLHPNTIGRVNFVTEGRNLTRTAASLCPGDSGGPVYSVTDNALIGINSYYTFIDNSGVSYTNLHTRLDLEDVRQWIENVGLDYNISL